MKSDLARQRIDPGSDVGCEHNSGALARALVESVPFPQVTHPTPRLLPSDSINAPELCFV